MNWITKILIIGLYFGLGDGDLPQSAPRDNIVTKQFTKDGKHVNSRLNLFSFHFG